MKKSKQKKNKKIIRNIEKKSKLSDTLKELFVPLIYIIIPLIAILLARFVGANPLIAFMSEMEVSNILVANSQYTIDQVITPFCISALLVCGFLIAYFTLKVIGKNAFKKVDYHSSAKKYLRIIEITMVLLAVIAVVYAKTYEFPYFQYGYSADTISEIVNGQGMQNVPLEKLPSIKSLGVNSPDANILYIAIMKVSQFFHLISSNFDTFIALAGGIIIPLKNYTESDKG